MQLCAPVRGGYLCPSMGSEGQPVEVSSTRYRKPRRRAGDVDSRRDAEGIKGQRRKSGHALLYASCLLQFALRLWNLFAKWSNRFDFAEGVWRCWNARGAGLSISFGRLAALRWCLDHGIFHAKTLGRPGNASCFICGGPKTFLQSNGPELPS